jgi:hypothetical protein
MLRCCFSEILETSMVSAKKKKTSVPGPAPGSDGFYKLPAVSILFISSLSCLFFFRSPPHSTGFLSAKVDAALLGNNPSITFGSAGDVDLFDDDEVSRFEFSFGILEFLHNYAQNRHR